MELLKRIIIITLLGISPLLCQAQPHDKALVAFKKSYELERQGDLQGAQNQLKAIYNEDSYEINLRLGWLTYQAGNFTEAEAMYNRTLSLKPYSEEARFGLILPKTALGKWDEVIKLYQQILENNPGNTKAHYNLGMIYYNRKNYNQALPHFKKVTDLYPFDYYGLHMLAWTYFQMGNTREAKVLFQKCQLYSPQDPSAAQGLELIK